MISVGQELRRIWAGRLRLQVSHEADIKLVAETESSKASAFIEWTLQELGVGIWSSLDIFLYVISPHDLFSSAYWPQNSWTSYMVVQASKHVCPQKSQNKIISLFLT